MKAMLEQGYNAMVTRYSLYRNRQMSALEREVHELRAEVKVLREEHLEALKMLATEMRLENELSYCIAYDDAREKKTRHNDN